MDLAHGSCKEKKNPKKQKSQENAGGKKEVKKREQLKGFFSDDTTPMDKTPMLYLLQQIQDHVSNIQKPLT